MIEAVIHRLKIETRRPENRLRLGGELKGSLRVAQQDVPLQLQDPVKAGNERNSAPEHPRFERRLVEGRAAPRSAAKALDETLDAQDDQLTEFVFADEIQAPGDSRHPLFGGSTRAIRSVKRFLRVKP